MPKKRGRPSKAAVERRQAEAIARGETISPQIAHQKSPIPPTPVSFSVGGMSSGMSWDSGPKKKRGRPSKAEVERRQAETIERVEEEPKESSSKRIKSGTEGEE